MNKIKMNDGTEYNVDFCGLSDGVVAFRMAYPMTASDAALAFSNASATGKITYLLQNEMVPDQPIVAAVYEGYTRLIGVLIDRWNGTPLIQLVKEA